MHDARENGAKNVGIFPHTLLTVSLNGLSKRGLLVVYICTNAGDSVDSDTQLLAGTQLNKHIHVHTVCNHSVTLLSLTGFEH